MLVRQAKSFARRIGKFGAGFTMRLGRSRHFRNAFPDQGVRDDELRFPVVALFRDIERIEKLPACPGRRFPARRSRRPGTHPGVFALRLLRHRVERDGVGVVNQDQIIEPEMAGERARFRRNAFLQTTIACQANDVLIENPMLAGIETRRRHFRRHRDPDRVAHALA